ncbi:MAG TPA: Asp-tRNA(Asn)/Glu-tRNA(Gln) amidotransferase GatCAB subunit C, partial [Kandleria vitulina]|nr:Asp-tRNA(Asn)/Glu-tRNA(Gln) amidotransferase GatCAB subunit C [Kandleria vitulina]
MEEEMLKELGRKTMFNITDEEMPALREEYHVFMNHVKALDAID